MGEQKALGMALEKGRALEEKGMALGKRAWRWEKGAWRCAMLKGAGGNTSLLMGVNKMFIVDFIGIMSTMGT